MSHYVKLFGSILDSTVWQAPSDIRIVWITMMAMADRDGIVEASIPGLARRAGVSVPACEDAIATFLAPDRYSRTKDFDGRRIGEVDGGWRLLNHDKYRDKQSAEEQRAKAAERQQRKRARERDCHAPSRSVTPSNDIRSDQITSDQINSEEAIAPPARESFDLDSICDRYPRRKGIAKGRDKLKTAIKTQSDFDAISKALDRFIAEQKRKGTEIDFYPYFSTWVNQRRWEDDDDPEAKPKGRAEPLPYDQVFTGYKDDLR